VPVPWMRGDDAVSGYYEPDPGEFWWCIRNLDLGNPVLTTIARLACVRYTIWPQELLGRDNAFPAVSHPDTPPCAPQRGYQFTQARRLAFCLARVFAPTLSAADIGEAFGDFRPSAVYAAWREADQYVELDGVFRHPQRSPSAPSGAVA
jgi:hypothetical protein